MTDGKEAEKYRETALKEANNMFANRNAFLAAKVKEVKNKRIKEGRVFEDVVLDKEPYFQKDHDLELNKENLQL